MTAPLDPDAAPDRVLRHDLPLLALVAAGAAVGGVLRALATAGAPHGLSAAVLLVNVAGSLALGALTALPAVTSRPGLLAALGPGLLGGWTTFSTASEDTRALLAAGRPLAGAAYALGTLAACLLAVEAGRRTVRAAAADVPGGGAPGGAA